MTGERRRNRAWLVLSLAVLAACGTEETPTAWSAPDLLIVDYGAGLFRYDAATAELREVAGESQGLVRPRRVLRLDDGRIMVVDDGHADGTGRALFRFEPETELLEKLVDLSHLDPPTDVLQVGPDTLLMSTRFILVEDRTQNSSALHEIDLRNRTVETILHPPEFSAVLGLMLEKSGRTVLVLDGDADPREQEYCEGVLFRFHLENRELETVHVFDNTVSPLQLHRLEGTALGDEAEYLLVDANALHPPDFPWFGKLFLMNVDEIEVRELLHDEHHLIDPVCGFLHEGRLVLAEMSSNPGGYDLVDTGINYVGIGGRGAIYTIDLASKRIEPLVHSPRFVDPVDVLDL